MSTPFTPDSLIQVNGSFLVNLVQRFSLSYFHRGNDLSNSYHLFSSFVNPRKCHNL